jgi:predicted transcriptional regulator of viral defense system
MTTIDYKNLAKDEIYLVSRAEFERQKVITTQFAQKLFADKNKASKTLASLTRKGWMIRIEKGKYIAVPLKAPNQQWMPNEFIVAGLWMGDTPYYIGYFTMYNYWGFTEQIPHTFFVLNTAKSRKITIGNIPYQAVKIDPSKYYGVQKIKIEDQEVCISDKERTLVDFAFNPLGSMRNFETALKENIREIDLPKFVLYLKKFPVVSVLKRAGFLLEEMGCENKYLNDLKTSIGKQKTFVVLNPFNKSRKGAVDKGWQIIVNR